MSAHNKKKKKLHYAIQKKISHAISVMAVKIRWKFELLALYPQ